MNTNNFIHEWEKLFQISFDFAKQSLKEKYPIKEDYSGSPNFVPKHYVIDRLPCAATILHLQIDKKEFPHLQSGIYPLIYYNIDKLQQFSIKFLGQISLSDVSLSKILSSEGYTTNFDNFMNGFTYELPVTSSETMDLKKNYHFLYYDPKKDVEQFQQNVTNRLDHFVSILAYDLKVLPNFNQMWKLKDDKIFSEHDLLNQDLRRDQDIVLEDNKIKKRTIKDHQQNAAIIQLIPEVPKNIERLFFRAKQLYVFSWFAYDFFPISEHYSVLTLESAIKQRYFSHFKNGIKIRNKKGVEESLGGADYSRVMTFCTYDKTESWDYHKIWINDEKFLYQMNDLLDWLSNKKIITLWEKQQCRYHLDTRNELSHQDYPPTYPGGAPRISLEKVARLINRMFSSCSIS